jgi:hypothetical protein
VTRKHLHTERVKLGTNLNQCQGNGTGGFPWVIPQHLERVVSWSHLEAPKKMAAMDNLGENMFS